MRDLSQETVWTFTEQSQAGVWGKCQLRKDPGIFVSSYMDLASKVAALQFHNPNFVLMFRGQPKDYRLKENENSTIRPSIFRRDEKHDPNRWNGLVEERYKKLLQAEEKLIQNWQETEGKRRITRSAVIRWAILQHYEVCDTPLLDVSSSLRIATSFASLESDSDEAFLMVLAIPQISGAVSSCAYHEMQALRLASLCPPSTTRPHIQEGYLIGEYPELRSFEEKMNLKLYETDFAQRLIGKFRFDPKNFWQNETFPLVPKDALYPNDHDALHELCARIKEQLKTENQSTH